MAVGYERAWVYWRNMIDRKTRCGSRIRDADGTRIGGVGL